MIKKWTSLFLFLLFYNSYSQSEEVDNCKLWRTELDTIVNYDLMIKHHKKYLSMVTDSCRLEIYNKIALNYRNRQINDSVFYYFEKVKELARITNNEEALGLVYTGIAEEYVNNNEHEKALKNLNLVKQIIEKDINSKTWVEYYHTMASMMKNKGNKTLYFKYLDSSLFKAINIKDTANLPNLYQNRGVAYFNNSQNYKAIEYLLKAVDLKEKQNALDIDVSYYVLGSSYNVLGNYSTAKKYLEKSLASSKKLGNEYVVLLSYFIIGKQQRVNGEYELAIKNIDSAEALAKKIKNDYNLAEIKLEKGRIYYSFQDLKKAETNFNEAYSISRRINSKYIAYQSTNLLHKINLEKKQYTKAKLFLDEFEKTIDGVNEKQAFHRTAGNYYKTIGDNKKALDNYLLSFKIYDSLYSVESNARIAELEKQYDTQGKELKIIALDKEKKEQELLTQKAKSRQNLFLLLSALLALLLILGFWVYNKLRKQKQELSSANSKLNEVNGVKNRLFSIIAHDLRSMLIPFQRAGKVLNHHVDKENYDRVKSLSNELQSNSNNLSNMLDNLLNWSLEQMNGYVVKTEVLSLKDEFESLISNFKQHAKDKNTTIELICNEDYTVFLDKGALHVIFRNLIGNALKYTENGIIKVTLKKELNSLKCTVIDTGVGMRNEQQEQLFKLEDNNSTTGTQGEKGTGLGLNLVYRFVTMLNGEISVSSKLRLGTRFDLSFPILESLNSITDNKSFSA